MTQWVPVLVTAITVVFGFVTYIFQKGGIEPKTLLSYAALNIESGFSLYMTLFL